jgi:hypothetical protein
VRKLLVDLHLNSALVHVKLSDWNSAIASANEVLAIDTENKVIKAHGGFLSSFPLICFFLNRFTFFHFWSCCVESAVQAWSGDGESG